MSEVSKVRYHDLLPITTLQRVVLRLALCLDAPAYQLVDHSQHLDRCRPPKCLLAAFVVSHLS